MAFRWHACETARSLGVAGWVRNLPDGRVEAWVEGEADDVERMLAWLRRGPPAARVRGLDAREREPAGAAGFDVRR